ncbi:hypothetical protein GCM10010252_22530 [Streptomyces aureoverticillatus]|nr:hypothetical protein GCM10010252_22530 [Streptomyces aureoverticillatus]
MGTEAETSQAGSTDEGSTEAESASAGAGDLRLLEVDASGAAPDEAPDLVVRALQAAVDDGRPPFSAVILMPPALAPRPPGSPAAAAHVRSLKELKPGLRTRCLGLAFVVPPTVEPERTKPMAAGEPLWGCPSMITRDAAEARAWAAERGRSPQS